MSNHAPLHFDLSTMDYFSAAVAGATTVVIPEVHTRMPASLSQLMEDQRLTVLYVVPLVLTHLLLHGALEQRDLSSLRWVLFGGEPFSPQHLRGLMAAWPEASFSNVYGPTEVNGVTHWAVPTPLPSSDEPLPIGRPLENVQMRVVDGADQVVVDGEVGELWVRTPSMMVGYWGRPDLDSRAFARVQTGQGAPDHVYHRTGDLVKVREDGNLDFIGRKDRQIKTRGYRVELDEVEAALATHEAVAAAATFGVVAPDGSQRIHAAVTLREAGLADEKALLRHAASILPRYALPEELSILEIFPRTSSGKIDRLALRDRAMSPLDPPDGP
jgi:acyl-coenzyme A synthetase/AMP-(fatty) acid ligase